MKKEIRAISVRMSLFAAYMLIYMCSQSMMVGQELPDMTDGTVKLYNDIDSSDSNVTIAVNGTAYAFDLIYIG